MCGIAGWINKTEHISDKKDTVIKMMDALEHRGPDDSGICVYENAVLGHRRLVVVDPKGGAQPMTKKSKVGQQYTIVYNGELYNTEDIRKKLLDKGYAFKSYSDTEVLLTAYIEWKEKCLNYINGIFAFGIWDHSNKTFFLARDPLGVKPLFYSIKGNSVIFASEIKALLKHPLVDPIVNEEGLMEILGLGPARSLGNGIFRDIREIPPAHYLMLDQGGIKINEYWKLEAKEHEETLEDTLMHTQELLADAIKRQLVSDVPICTFLSGGLDSSIISAVAAKAFEKEKREALNTFSIDYTDNKKNYVYNELQPDLDSTWIPFISKYIGSRHTNIVLDNKELAEKLYQATLASDLPGMADIDSSLLLFCREVKKHATVALSGECADEIFGGYPWFRKDYLHSNTFPWAKSIDYRKTVLSHDLKKLPLEEYVNQKYQDTIGQVPKLKNESHENSKMREMFYLNIKWFMITLLNRKDRMSMNNSLEVRVPFADYRIVQYAYNIPMKMKFYKDREKGLLREALKDYLPKEILQRKKSPYPKTYSPVYTECVQNELKNIIADKTSPLLDIIDKENVNEIIKTKGASFKKPWYGQLMMGPQVMAYLIQINTWMKEYKVRLSVKN